MPTKYPWQRADPSTSTPTSSSSRATPSGQSSSSGPSILLNHSSGTSTNGNGNCSDKDRAVVVSASGRAAFSPNANTGSSNGGLGVEGSPQLRIRNSPRTGAGAGAGAGGAFGSMRDSYPSPSSNALRTPVRNGVHGADSSNTGGSSGGAGAGAGVGSRVRTIFGRRRKNSDTINMDGLDVSISSSPAGTPIHDRLAAAAAGAGAGAGGRGGWRQVPVDSPGSSTAGSPAPRSNAQAQAQSGRGGKGGVPVKRFDARGYPTRDELHADSKIDSPTKVAMLGHGRRRSAESTDSEGGSDVAAIGANAYGPGANTGAGAGGVGSTGSRKMGSGEGQTAAARYAFSSRQSYLNSTANGNGKATSFSSSSGPGAGVEKAKSTSLYPPTLTNYSLSSPSYSPSDPHGPSTSSSTVNGGERRSGGRADYFAATASILGGYENVRTPSDDQGLSGSHATGAAGRTGGSGGGAGGSSGRSSKGRYPSASPSSSLYASHTGPAPGYESFEPTHYDGYGYAKSITGTMRTHRTQGSEGTMGTMGSRAYLGRYDALQDQFVKDHGEGEGYEYGVGGIKGQGWSVGSRGGNKHLGHMFSLPPDPSTWSYLGPEADDEFHDPDVKPRGRTGFLGAMFTLRGAGNVGCLAVLVVVLVGMFAVYPITSQFLNKVQPTYGAYNLGGINATGQIPDIGPFQLIDHDTPTSAYTHTSFETGETWDLVFSDEFNRDGRTFWPGDDPFWEAQDLHYWQTNNKEWYHPTMVTTVGGSLRITLTNEKMNGLNYTGGSGYVEASVSLPGKNNVYGLWPAIWTLGNLGRAGFGGTLDGVWPYSYDTCDRGTLHNQTLNGQPVLPSGAGDKNNLDHLSYLPGQRLSRCTCPDDPTHPGPKHPDGTWVGRAAPEIDMFEAVIDSDTMLGEVSQSAQWAPFDPYYQFDNATANFDIYNASMTYINPWLGSVWQQATTALSYTDPNCYTGETGCYSRYGFEYASGNDGYITWLSDNRKAWTVRGAAMGANAVSMVGDRPIPQEPMYLLLNLGLSENFGPVDYEGLEPLFPVHMDVDYIRVYQDPSKHNIGCDPVEFPTQSYINRFIDVYNNPNITVMGQIENFTIPRNSLIDTC